MYVCRYLGRVREIREGRWIYNYSIKKGKRGKGMEKAGEGRDCDWIEPA